MSDFEKQLEVGRRYEKAVARWLMARGWLILPVYDFSGLAEKKAPKLLAGRSWASLVMPDLLACRSGKSLWAEVKWKTHADWWRIGQRHETGINRRLWDQYWKVQEESGTDAWIVFVHQQESEIRGDSMRNLLALPPRYYDGEKMGRGGMVFFPYDKLPVLASLDEVMREEAA